MTAPAEFSRKSFVAVAASIRKGTYDPSHPTSVACLQELQSFGETLGEFANSGSRRTHEVLCRAARKAFGFHRKGVIQDALSAKRAAEAFLHDQSISTLTSEQLKDFFIYIGSTDPATV